MSADPHIAGLTGRIVHDEIVPARAPWLHHIAAGQTLRIVDLEGNQAVDFLLYATADDAERYSAQDTVAAQGNLFLREGTVLRSNEGRAMMTITASAVDYHDTIGGACSCESNTLRYGHHTKSEHACVENFLEANLRAIARDLGPSRMDILAHSMGTLLTLETLRQAAIDSAATTRHSSEYQRLPTGSPWAVTPSVAPKYAGKAVAHSTAMTARYTAA